MDEEYILNYDGDLTPGITRNRTDNTGGITINTTDNDFVISSGGILYNSYGSYSTRYDMDFKLPDSFLKVIKLMVPEIKNVIVSSSSLEVGSLGSIGDLTINLFIVLDETSPGGKFYEEIIRDLFRMTFPNIEYVTLNVKQFDSDSNKKFDELLTLFGK
jgi:hypothetical protein